MLAQNMEYTPEICGEVRGLIETVEEGNDVTISTKEAGKGTQSNVIENNGNITGLTDVNNVSNVSIQNEGKQSESAENGNDANSVITDMECQSPGEKDQVHAEPNCSAADENSSDYISNDLFIKTYKKFNNIPDTMNFLMCHPLAPEAGTYNECSLRGKMRKVLADYSECR